MTGEEVVIARDNKPLLKLVPVSPLVREERKSGSAKGRILYIAPDFDQTPADFGEYI
jgi:antitoxin (DNA-binding transcriptional repressor) of toxin-antitoxin stability system